MTRRLLVLVHVLVLVLGSSAFAQSEPASEPASEPTDDQPPPGPVAEQELGARIGLGLGVGSVSPGGFAIRGDWLYRLSERFWFDGEATFLLGSSDPSCYLGRDRTPVCSTGVTSGTSFAIRAGVSYFLPRRSDGFVPYGRAGVGLGLVSLPDDGISGVEIPLWVASGVRVRVNDFVAVRGEAVLSAGPAFYGSGVGVESAVTFVIQLGVDFAITKR